MASVGPERCPYCGGAPCVGEDCPCNWLCTSCGISPSVPPWTECADCRRTTERTMAQDARDEGDGYDPGDDESWMEDVP